MLWSLRDHPHYLAIRRNNCNPLRGQTSDQFRLIAGLERARPEAIAGHVRGTL